MMETKSILQSKRSWLNYGSVIALALTGLISDDAFKSMVIELLGAKGIIILMIIGAVLNQFLTQTSDKVPKFQMPKSNLDILDEPNQADDYYTKDF